MTKEELYKETLNWLVNNRMSRDFRNKKVQSIERVSNFMKAVIRKGTIKLILNKIRKKKVYVITSCDTLQTALSWSEEEYYLGDEELDYSSAYGTEPGHFRPKPSFPPTSEYFSDKRYYIISERSSGIGLYYVDMLVYERNKRINQLI